MFLQNRFDGNKKEIKKLSKKRNKKLSKKINKKLINFLLR